MKALIIRRALVWYVRIFKIKLQNCIFQILCNISNSLHHFKFASWLWILCSLAGLVTDGQNEYCENWRRWLKEIKKVEKSESLVFPPWAPWSWRPRTTRPSHTVGILSIGYNYNIFFVFSITSIIICWNELWPRKNIFCFNCFLFTSSGTGILGLFRISTAERSFFTENDSCERNVIWNMYKRQENIKPWIILRNWI